MSTSANESRQVGCSILLADGSLLGGAVRILLQQLGYRVLWTGTGTEALGLLAERPDAVVAAARMPGLGGYELCQILKDDPATRPLPVLLLTGDGGGLGRFWIRSCRADKLLGGDPEPHQVVAAILELLSRPGLVRPGPGGPDHEDRSPAGATLEQCLGRVLGERVLETALRDRLGRLAGLGQNLPSLLETALELIGELAPGGAIHVAVRREGAPFGAGVHGPEVGAAQRAAMVDRSRQALGRPGRLPTRWKVLPEAPAPPGEPVLFAMPLGTHASQVTGCLTFWLDRATFFARERLFEAACQELDRVLEQTENRLGSRRNLVRRQQAEAELRETGQRLQLATRSAGMGSFEWDIPRDMRHFDDTVHRLIGTDPAHFSGGTLDFYHAIHPEDREHVRASLARAMAKGEYETEYRAVWADGSIHHIAARGRLFLDAHGRPARLNGVLWDITARKQAEAALHHEQTFTRALLEHLVEGVVACDAQGELVLFNRSLREWQGADPLRLPQEQWAERYDLFEPDGATPLATEAIPLVRAFHGETIQGVEIAICAPGRPVRQVLANGAPIRDGQGRSLGAVVVMHDITERRQAEGNLRELNAELEDRIRKRTSLLEQANAELDAFSYSVSHDLRAPLRGIDGFSQALLEEYEGQLDDKARHYLLRVRAGTLRMGELIEGLLRLARVSRTDLDLQTLDLSAMATGLLEEMRGLDPGRRLEVSVEEGLAATGDPVLIRAVLQNLLGNSVKYTARTPVARIAFYRETQADGTEAFCTRDNGAGFDMAHADKLFAPFQRLHSADEFEGSGVGLSVVQRIIRRHGGRVWAQAAPGLGATFAFTLGPQDRLNGSVPNPGISA